jgi:hypothetical protein
VERLSLGKRTLRKFGVTMGIALMVTSGLFFFREKHTGTLFSLLASGIFFITGLVSPVLLKPVYIIWMRFAFILGWINTRIILVILFYLVFTPFGLFMRLFRIDLLERKKKEGSYWKPKEKIDFNPINYERRF